MSEYFRAEDSNSSVFKGHSAMKRGLVGHKKTYLVPTETFLGYLLILKVNEGLKGYNVGPRAAYAAARVMPV